MGEGVVWREVYQSSPTAVVLRSDTEFRAWAERMQLPADYAETLRARPVTGTLRLRFPLRGMKSAIRLRLSNEEGASPLLITRATAGIKVGEELVGIRAVTFGGEEGISLPAGAPAVSDPVELPRDANGELIPSFHLPDPVAIGGLGQCFTETAPGDQTSAARLDEATPLVVRPFVTAVLQAVERQENRVVAVLGDSLSDAHCSPSPSWPELLQRRLAEEGSGSPLFISNASIGGNRLLSSGLYPEMGVSGLARLDRDVLRIDGLSHIVVLLGTNDIGLSGAPHTDDGRPLDAKELIAGYRQIICRARLRGVEAVFATLLPFAGSAHATAQNEATRQAVNEWIRSSGEPDAVIDFEAAVRDPALPTALRSEYDLGDHLHVSEAGLQALAGSVDLSIFDTDPAVDA